jgi:hypothetical protein
MSKKFFSESQLKRAVGVSLVVVALMASNVLPASADPEVRPIEIVVQAASDPCAGILDTPATWSPGDDLVYTSPAQVGSNPFTVDGYASVDLELAVSWTPGSTCVGGNINEVLPSGVVQANWSIETPLTLTYTTCQDTACGAGTGGYFATVEVPGGIDAGTYNGSLTLTWIP